MRVCWFEMPIHASHFTRTYTQKDAMNVLLGKIVPLRHGYVGVVNRSQHDIDTRLPIKVRVCVCVCERERECVRERESVCV
jgi:hypothetical protein